MTKSTCRPMIGIDIMEYFVADRKNRSMLKLLLMTTCMTIVTAFNQTENFKFTEHDAVSEQFCTGETFRPRCVGGRNDVIVILSARYGRMNFGRCVEEEPELDSMKDNPRFIGCSADVKHILDQKCSGYTECDLRITNQIFEGVKPCMAGLQMYLETSYACIKVAAESRHCTVPLTTEPQHIVGGGRSGQVLTDTVGCGTESQPWLIEALSGQRVAVSLIDFGQASNTADDSLKIPGCHSLYGFIIDKNSRTNKTICTSSRQDLDRGQASLYEERSVQTNIYTSRSNQLQIFTKIDVADKFILRVEAVGCSDLAPPSDSAWLKRVDDQITVGCYMSRQSWKLTCVNGVWTGTVGVCSHTHIDEDAGSNNANEAAKVQHVNHGHASSTELAALVAVASAGIALCCLVICIGVFCLRRQQRLSRKDQAMQNPVAVREYYQNENCMNTQAGLLAHSVA